jgi:hypothetical protein
MSNGNTPLINVPENKVGEVVQQYIDWDGVTQVSCVKDQDGTWRVVAR